MGYIVLKDYKFVTEDNLITEFSCKTQGAKCAKVFFDLSEAVAVAKAEGLNIKEVE